jgi:predicted transcriptional regulator
MVNETIEILKLLMSSREERLSIRRISQLRKINYKSAYLALRILEKKKLVSMEKTGNTTICAFNNNFDEMVFQAESLRREELFRNKDFLIIHNRLSELKFPFIAILFGSQAKGNSNKNSDTDILSIGGNEKKIRAALSLLPGKIHLTAINYERFIQMAKSREFSVVSEALKNNIILIGIEEYYRLLQNAR